MEGELYWVGVDLDDTLATNSGTPDFILGEPIEGAKAFMEELIARGYKPIIHTARHWGDYIIIEEWLNKHEIPFKRIICGKPLFYRMVDDKNIEFDGDWSNVLQKL